MSAARARRSGGRSVEFDEVAENSQGTFASGCDGYVWHYCGVL